MLICSWRNILLTASKSRRLLESMGRGALGTRVPQRSVWNWRSLLRSATPVVLACAIGDIARAQAPAESPLVLPEVQVEGQRAAFKQRVEIFVRGMTKSSALSSDESLVRWNAPVCFLATGFSEEDRRTISARLSQIASLSGIPVAHEPCQANFVIVATSEPGRVLAAWRAKNSGMFGDATPSQIREFLDAPQPRPIRVWRNIDRGRTASMRYGHFRASNTHAQSSPFILNAVLGFSSVFAIIDTAHSAQLTLHQLSDYVAMAGLTNADLDPDIGNSSSILRLFADPSDARAAGLSSWDSAFLRALYQTDQASRSQRFAITKRLLDVLSR
jgi:hypothetical protein